MCFKRRHHLLYIYLLTHFELGVRYVLNLKINFGPKSNENANPNSNMILFLVSEWIRILSSLSESDSGMGKALSQWIQSLHRSAPN